MKLTVENLRQAGAFTGGAVRREVEWLQKGEMVRADVWVRPLSYQTATADIQSMRGGENPWVRRVVICICQEDGSPVFQLSDITGIGDDGKPIMVPSEDGKSEVERGGLNQSLFDALVMLIIGESGLGKMITSSTPKRNSGTSSSSTASAVALSKKRKRG